MKSLQTTSRLALMAFALGSLAAARVASAQAYCVQNVQVPGSTFYYLNGINNSGKVVGAAYIGSYPMGFIWDAGTITFVGAYDGQNSDARGINDSEQVTGWSSYTQDQDLAAFLYNNGVLTNLGTLGGSESFAAGINNAGQVTGYGPKGSGIIHAFRTAPNSSINPATDDLSTLSGNPSDGSNAYGINNLGQVAGASNVANGDFHAFRTAPNSPINPVTDDLGSLGGNESGATGINDSGQVVGASINASGLMHAFRTAANMPIDPATDDLGTLGGSDSTAYGINRAGIVVGTSFLAGDQGSHSFISNGSTMLDLNTLVVGEGSQVGVPAAYAINDSGMIVTDQVVLVPINLVNIQLKPGTVVGGKKVSCRVTLSEAAPKGGVIVMISTTNPAAHVPTMVKIAKEHKSKTFTISTDFVASMQTGSVTATLGLETKTSRLTVKP